MLVPNIICEVFSCDNLGDCVVYECLLQEPMEANGEPASIEIDFTFSKVMTILDLQVCIMYFYVTSDACC